MRRTSTTHNSTAFSIALSIYDPSKDVELLSKSKQDFFFFTYLQWCLRTKKPKKNVRIQLLLAHAGSRLTELRPADGTHSDLSIWLPSRNHKLGAWGLHFWFVSSSPSDLTWRIMREQWGISI